MGRGRDLRKNDKIAKKREAVAAGKELHHHVQVVGRLE
jgi:hypothetical protein